MSNISNQSQSQSIDDSSSGALANTGIPMVQEELLDLVKSKVHWLDVIDTMQAIWAKDELLVLDFSPAGEKDSL